MLDIDQTPALAQQRDSFEHNGCTADFEAVPPFEHSPQRWRLLPCLPPTRSWDNVPVLFREPHVTSGFRAMHQPWKYYLWSVFQLHNESMNVWTHLLALVLTSHRLWEIMEQLDLDSDPYCWPLVAGLLCGVLLYACSSVAHCVQSRSELTHYVAFMVDYAGIGLYGLGSIILHLWYCSEPEFYVAVQSFFVPLGTVLAVLICLCCSMAKVVYTRPYPFARKVWQMSPVAGIYVVLISPIVHRLLTCYVWGTDCTESVPCHLRQVIWFALSGTFFASDFPQRLRPGLCDYFGHSHQLFHVCIMLCTLAQMDGVYADFQTRGEVYRQRPTPTLGSAFGPILIVSAAELLIIITVTVCIKASFRETNKQE